MNQVSKVTGEKVVPVLYTDLDGTVRKGKDELGRFVNGPEDVELFDGVKELLWAYKQAGWRIIACSNQGGIALGYMSRKDNMDAMVRTQELSDQAFDKIIWCQHHPQAEDPEMAVCWCRKPRCGMIIESALELSGQTNEIYPPHLALFVGDLPEDRECAFAANIPFLGAEVWRSGAHLQAWLHAS